MSPASAALVGATDLNTFQLQSESEEVNLKLSHENKKVLSPFYRKKNFLIQNEFKTPFGVLHSFSIKIIFIIEWT